MLTHIFLLTAAVLASAPSVVVRDAEQPPKGWVVIAPPETEAQWRCANYSQQEWVVSGNSAQSVSISPYEHASEIKLTQPDGELIGINHGEFGGRIEWIGQDAVRRVLVPDKNPVAFTIRGDDVFVATGLAHMGIDSGEIIKLHRVRSGTWQVSTVMDLGEAPNAGTRISDVAWILLTTNGVTKVNLLKLTKEQIYRNKNWGMLYANSIRPLGNSWIVGARRAVIKIKPVNGTYAEEWLVPASCKSLEKSTDPNCECKQ